METYTLQYAKLDSQWKFTLDTGSSNPVLYDNTGGGRGGRWEGGSRGQGRTYTYGWIMLMYGRNQHNIVKQVSFNQK